MFYKPNQTNIKLEGNMGSDAGGIAANFLPGR